MRKELTKKVYLKLSSVVVVFAPPYGRCEHHHYGSSMPHQSVLVCLRF
jgi:hypothetical protein